MSLYYIIQLECIIIITLNVKNLYTTKVKL